jgi:hypothetical protein
MPRGPRKMLLGDEGSSALRYFDLDDPGQNWTYQGPGRDLQLIGRRRLLRSAPQGYVELDLTNRGALLRNVVVADAPGGIESARRLPDGHTVIVGNGGGGIFVWEIDGNGVVVPGRQQLFEGIDKARMLRLTEDDTFLFCSETNGQKLIHEASWENGLQTLFEIPSDVPADSMVKAVRVAKDTVTVSTGYAASLVRIDTAQKKVLQTIGGRASRDDSGKRPLSPHFFSGYQMFADGDYLVANWQGHGTGHNGQGYQLLQYDREGKLVWRFDQTEYPIISSLNNVIALDGLDTDKLHDERSGVLTPIELGRSRR